jgi:hypothetical protein
MTSLLIRSLIVCALLLFLFVVIFWEQVPPLGSSSSSSFSSSSKIVPIPIFERESFLHPYLVEIQGGGFTIGSVDSLRSGVTKTKLHAKNYVFDIK